MKQKLLKPWRIFKYGVSQACIWIVCRWCPLELKKMIDEESMARGQKIAQEIIMKYLDKNGFLHCYVCPSRFGLVKREVMKEGKRFDVYLCPTHQAGVQTTEAAAAGQRR